MKYKELTELKQEWSTPNTENGYLIIAFRGRIWKLPKAWDELGDVPEEVINQIEYHTGEEDLDLEDVYDLASSRPDILIGHVDSTNVLNIQRTTGSMSPRSSSMIQKLVKELGIRAVNLENFGFDDYTNSYYTKREISSFPDTLFHGTTAFRLQRIAKIGLRPNQKGNWEQFKHKGLIFGTAEFSDAIFHANRTAGINADNNEPLSPEDDFPVIIEFKIPDKTKIVPDYDVASTVIGHDSDDETIQSYMDKEGYGFYFNSMISDQNPEGRVWKNSGIFGYKGWIPPTHISRVYTNFFGGAISDDEVASITSLKGFFEEWETQIEDFYGEFDDEDY